MRVDHAPNLGQRLDDLPAVSKKSAHRWFSEARFGIFVHYGLYSIHGEGEWHMDRKMIPKEEYNLLADGFRAEKFDADELAGLAKRAGAEYVVLTARHHDGFCLFDTQTTEFSSVRKAAKRDLIREYTDACRRAGLRVGLYYSIMSWQWPAIYSGPHKDPEGWEAMVRETHEQMCELMTHYGPIDLVWYDGCVVPGVSDLPTIARYWRSRELNAMARELQPGILINDRSCLPEDYSTPEQHLTLPPRGRLWEMCMTINDHWGWFSGKSPCKPAEQLIRQLVLCARYDGNFLLNIGPCADGTVAAPLVERLEAIGHWMAANGESVRGTRRTAYTEAEHLLGMVTSRGRRLYFHAFDWPGVQARVAGLTSRISSAKLLATGAELAVEQFPDGTATLRGLPAKSPCKADTVIAIEFSCAVPSSAPPELLIEADTGLFDPAEAKVNVFEDSGHRDRYEIALPVSATGKYRLECSVVGGSPLRLFAKLDNRRLSDEFALTCVDYPDVLRAENISLQLGDRSLVLSSEDNVPFNLLAWRLQPLWRQLRSESWLTIGPFPSPYRVPGTDGEVLAAMRTSFPPEKEFRSDATYEGAGGKYVSWHGEKKSHPNVDFSRVGNGESGVCFARTVVMSLERRSAQVLLGCDWWANLFLNGEEISSLRDPEAVKRDGAWFNGWKPLAANITLKKGENVFLVKCHQGRAGNWFSFYLNEAAAAQEILFTNALESKSHIS
ncbi:MAG: alpha-L-fucosidase [Verrucomicrobiota bacterium]